MTRAAIDPVPLQVAAPVGPAPTGAPVEVSVPFAAGVLKEGHGLAVMSPAGKPVLAQLRPAMRWPDGSVRWLFVVFEAEAGPGTYQLAPGRTPDAGPLLSAQGDTLVINTGATVLSLLKNGGAWFDEIAALQTDGKTVAVLCGGPSADLVMTKPDGSVFRSRLAGGTRRVIVEDTGPVRASVRIEGRCRNESGQPLLDFIARWQLYRGRSQAILTVTWINATDNPGERVRDLRVVFPFDFLPNRIVCGAETGVYDAPWMRGNTYFLLQEDHNQYWAKRIHTDGRTLHMATGGANGHHCPGWLYVQNDGRCLGAYVPRFWEEYPNEITVKEGELAVGLWPGRANAHLASKPLLPPNDDPNLKLRFQHLKYWPILPHPYLAFFSPEDKCLEAPQGVAKTQTIVLDVGAGAKEEPTFEKKIWQKSLEPARGVVSPAQVASSLAVGRIWPADPSHFPEAERTFQEAFDWCDRHPRIMECYSKFDYGDFKYMVPATNYLTEVGKWASMQEMPREGYWHNNERDTLRGLLLHYLRTGNPHAFDVASATARHLLDVDLRHYPHWGMYTHGYGHCYRALGTGGEPDHAWLLGLLEWAGVSGDPIVLDWTMKCGEQLLRFKTDFAHVDTRTTSMQLHMMTTFYRYTDDRRYLEAAKPPADALLKTQREDGSWSKYLSKPKDPAGFVEHAILAVADYYDLTKEERFLPVITKALAWYLPKDADRLEPTTMTSDVPLLMLGLDVAARATKEEEYVRWAKKVYTLLDQSQNRSPDPNARGEFWPGWAINEPEKSRGTGRPPQFVGQARPLGPSTLLAYGPMAMCCIAKAEGWRKPDQ